MRKSTPDASAMRVLPWIVGISFFMQMLDGSILNIALPAIAASLGMSPLRMHAVVIAYMLTVAALIPASSWLADRFGTRRVFVTSIAVFTLGSLACALSSSLETLVLSRILQGVGGALLVPVGRLAILRLFPRERLLSVLSFISLPGLIGPLLGPTLGGAIVHYATWQWIFLINIPVGLLGIAPTLRHMPECSGDGAGLFDWSGFFLFGLFMIGATLSLESLGENPMPFEARAGMAAASALFLGLFAFHAKRNRNALFSPALLRIRNFAVGLAGNLFARLGMGAMPFLTPLLLQVGLGYSPLKAGLTLLPLTIGAIVSKSLVSGLIKRAGFRRFLFINTLLVGGMLACCAFIGKNTPYAAILGLLGLAGAINSFQFTGMNTVTLIDLPPDMASGGNSLLSAIVQLAMGMGVALAAALLDFFTLAGQEPLPAFQRAYLILGGASAVSAFIFLQTRDCSAPAEHA